MLRLSAKGCMIGQTNRISSEIIIPPGVSWGSVGFLSRLWPVLATIRSLLSCLGSVSCETMDVREHSSVRNQL